ncbi:hypothetical protein KCP71_15045 [Salmonella enterica subsp. enterica]|nr:hypothetical protein KCP71_15045 [Salmonella enterica subsp. enterica]
MSCDWLHVPRAGVQAWMRQFFHLMTHAFFKALLFPRPARQYSGLAITNNRTS